MIYAEGYSVGQHAEVVAEIQRALRPSSGVSLGKATASRGFGVAVRSSGEIKTLDQFLDRLEDAGVYVYSELVDFQYVGNIVKRGGDDDS